jgi:type IV pilus assembly protein PilC
MADNLQAFEWNGINAQGKRVKGILRVNDGKEVQAELRKQGIELIGFKLRKEINVSFGKGGGVKLKNILLFTRNLSTMLASGLPILQALEVISHDKDNDVMRGFIVKLRSNISGGKTLAETFAEYPEHFSSLYTSLIKAGEKSGTLDKILLRLGNYLERSETLRKKVKKALIYPAAIITVAFIVSSIMLIFVVPKFKSLFDSFGAKLPLFTRIIIAISNFMQSYWWIVVLIIMALVWMFRRGMRNSLKFHFWVDSTLLKTPIIGEILRKAVIARFARTLSTTLESGMPITEAMRSMVDIMGNRVYSRAVAQICTDVTSGHQLNVSMTSSGLFPHMVIQMISVGEASGSLSPMLHKVADYYEEEVNYAVDNLSSLLEPLIMLLLGVIIGSLVIAMYLPIFKLGSLF